MTSYEWGLGLHQDLPFANAIYSDKNIPESEGLGRENFFSNPTSAH
jgi:hypothetical protein